RNPWSCFPITRKCGLVCAYDSDGDGIFLRLLPAFRHKELAISVDVQIARARFAERFSNRSTFARSVPSDLGLAGNAAKKESGVRAEKDVFDAARNFQSLGKNREHESWGVGPGTGPRTARTAGNAGS